MIGLPGLRGQSLGPPFVRPGATLFGGLRGLVGFAPRVRSIALSRSPPNIAASAESGTITTPTATVTPQATRRGEVFRSTWSQVSGIAGTASGPDKLASNFAFNPGSPGSYPQVWRCTVENNFGEQGFIDVPFTITRNTPAPTPPSYSIGSASNSANSSSAVSISVTVYGSPSGGSGSYTSYSWPSISGFSAAPSGASCTYTAPSVAPGATVSGSGSGTVTDSNGLTSSPAGFSISVQNTGTAPPPFSISVSPTVVTGSNPTGNCVAGPASATASGAVGSVSWSWVKTGGYGNLSPSGASASFSYFVTEVGVFYEGTFDVTGTDSLGRSDTKTVTARFIRPET